MSCDPIRVKIPIPALGFNKTEISIYVNKEEAFANLDVIIEIICCENTDCKSRIRSSGGEDGDCDVFFDV